MCVPLLLRDLIAAFVTCHSYLHCTNIPACLVISPIMAARSEDLLLATGPTIMVNAPEIIAIYLLLLYVVFCYNLENGIVKIQKILNIYT